MEIAQGLEKVVPCSPLKLYPGLSQVFPVPGLLCPRGTHNFFLWKGCSAVISMKPGMSHFYNSAFMSRNWSPWLWTLLNKAQPANIEQVKTSRPSCHFQTRYQGSHFITQKLAKASVRFLLGSHRLLFCLTNYIINSQGIDPLVFPRWVRQVTQREIILILWISYSWHSRSFYR